MLNNEFLQDSAAKQDAFPSAHACCATSEHANGIESMPEEELLYDLADLFKVFSDTTRIKILYALMTDELSVNEIAETIGASQSAVSHQLRILKQARLVRFRREGRSIMYALADDHVYTMLAQGIRADRLLIHTGGLGQRPAEAGGIQGGAGGEDAPGRPVQLMLDVVGDDVGGI